MFCCLNVKNKKYISEQIKVTVSIFLVFNTENHSRKYPYGNSRIRNNNPYKDIVIYHFSASGCDREGYKPDLMRKKVSDLTRLPGVPAKTPDVLNTAGNVMSVV